MAELNQSGRYEIEGDERGMRLLNHNAPYARLMLDGRSRPVPMGYRASIDLEQDGAYHVEIAYTNFINDPDFTRYFDYLARDEEENARWRCSSVVDLASDAIGVHRKASLNGIDTLRFLRQGDVAGHGANRCYYQFLGSSRTSGLSVSEYDHLGIQATFLIQQQSLSRCGFPRQRMPHHAATGLSGSTRSIAALVQRLLHPEKRG